jgi:hypothetical protein
LSPKRALALVEALPLDSAFCTAQRGGSAFAGWDRHAYMLADIFDALQAVIYVLLAVNSEKPSKVKQPGKYPRPDDKQKQDDKPDILLARLRGEATNPVQEVGRKLIPLPPS